jgi:hypothetical protein
MIKRTSILPILVLSNILAFGQAQLPVEAKIYEAPNGRFYINKTLPVYIRLSTSKDPNAKSYLLQSELSKEMVNPFNYQIEGANVVQLAPYRLDPTTKRPIVPQKPIDLDVYADGTPPESKAALTGGPFFQAAFGPCYGKGLNIDITSKDAHAGVEKIFFSTNGSAYSEFKSTTPINQENRYTIKYYATDNVGNIEQPKVIAFAVDLTPPKTAYKINGNIVNHTLSDREGFTLTSSDNMSGVKSTFYIIDNEPQKVFAGPISMKQLKDGQHKITFWSVDMVDNVEDKNAPENSFSFYLDRLNPEVTVTFDGDQYQKTKDIFYISGRTKIKVDAKDNYSGVEKITYILNQGGELGYVDAFTLSNMNGLVRLDVKAVDKMGNLRLKTQEFYVGTIPPSTGLKLGKPQKFTNDTLFINKSTEISFFRTNYDAGLKFTKYKIDNGPEMVYDTSFYIKTDGYHIVTYYSTDNVNNVERTKTSRFTVDNSSPEIFLKFSVDPVVKQHTNGKAYNQYPLLTRMFIGANDKGCGNETILFSISPIFEGNEMRDYSLQSNTVKENFLSVEGLYKVKVKATDKLGNESYKEFEFLVKK